MAYTKTVAGRSYPYLYNVTMTVGSRKSLTQKKEYGTKRVGSAGGFGVSVPTVKTTSVYTSSFERFCCFGRRRIERDTGNLIRIKMQIWSGKSLHLRQEIARRCWKTAGR